ncbi:hypothetical protein AB0J72_21085 [Dactylosporangium sp. NPDC049742]|uniref:hypothetical protein n=1 Tax=Dactylosporangium sp. NPDC049742 TaxID=3154737 RepID=UPI0034229CC7
MKIDVRTDLVDEQLEQAWQLYEAAFRHLNALTIQRHLMYRSEFDDVMSDRRVEKWLAYSDDGVLLGLATYTNQLSAWPLISPEYFARRWPVHYADQRIWYCGFVAVPTHEHGMFVKLIEAMYRHAEQHDGVISLDICRHNIDAYRLDRAINTWLRRISDNRVRCETADAQTFMIYETAPAAGEEHLRAA